MLSIFFRILAIKILSLYLPNTFIILAIETCALQLNRKGVFLGVLLNILYLWMVLRRKYTPILNGKQSPNTNF